MNCVFGIFDVLGFTSFCENCEPQAAEKVLKIIDDFETEIPRLVWQYFDPDNQVPKDKKDMVTGRLRWLTFSDTVFMAMPLEADDKADTVKFNLIFLPCWWPTLTGACLKSACRCGAQFMWAK